MATVVAMALTAVGPWGVRGLGSRSKGISTAAPAHGITDVSARRGSIEAEGGAAAAAAFAGIVGTGIAIAASRPARLL